ncbi:PAS domain S-box protein [Sulfurimonas aquatica]|uniref:PAS domain S-box protein n=1 Tax=Sulfurimonas aquatica TaxID=2672570 RepID=A0A975AYV8_9BACT|nr:PAS domain-containing protein [Sulfurimonas aquatica]QSZ41035.1 PAS domain S-box protein [Sulfurimonas aquatica]
MNKVTPVNKEHIFEANVIISQTDAKGIITYANKAFCEVSGYKVDELVGTSHNIVRHPDMPKVLFSRMWETIKGGQVWNGLIKNLRKDGLYYWVDTEILPIKNSDEEITGYIAARKIASRKDINENKEAYSKMLDTQE